MKQFLVTTGLTAFSIFVAACSSAPVASERECSDIIGTEAIVSVDENGNTVYENFDDKTGELTGKIICNE